ncbi:MAG TPA: intradiol ring-cleavage dioxygenase [Candidatus Binatia bacterium]|nr:intradiol ring-cleavage dioxygenase [Candidatus Binatia bacterium]
MTTVPFPEQRTFEGRSLPRPDEPVFDQGLAFDVGTISRRRVIQALGFGVVSAGLFTIAGCEPSGAGSSASAGAQATIDATAASCAVIPGETAGPYPGDGTNGPDVLTESGVVRRDIRSSIGGASGMAAGIPLTIRLQIVDAADGCAPMDGAAVYLWHCDQAGRYSMYSAGVEDENYLRGVQASGADGIVEFLTVFPGCYQGRWPHVHFEVYPDIAAATDASNIIATSQLALPQAICDEVYATTGYESSARNLEGQTIESDNIFGDENGATRQLGIVSGSLDSDLAIELVVPVVADRG